MPSRIILPQSNGNGPRSLKRGSDFVTMDELIQLIGPQAKLLVEFNDRLAGIEEKLGIVSPAGDLPICGDVE